MQERYDEMIEELRAFIEDIVSTAMEDSVITEDEEKLITEIKQQINDLKNLLSLSLESAEDIDALDQLFKDTLKRMISDSIETAKDDDVISTDEVALIRKIIEFQERMAKKLGDN